MNELSDALRQAASNPEIVDDVRALLESDATRQTIAALIEKSADKHEYLSVKGVNEQVYLLLRNTLNGKDFGVAGKIVAKRGRTGGLKKIETGQVEVPQVKDEELARIEKESTASSEDALRLEKQYYPVVRQWADEQGYDNCLITGGKLPGYKWENPDLVWVDISVEKITVSISIEVVSFEVKLDVSPLAVWQAAHYAKFSHEIYVAFAKNADYVRAKDEGRVFDLAVQLGLGVLAYDQDKKKFQEIQSPRRMSPSTSSVSELIENFSAFEQIKRALNNAKAEYRENIGELIFQRT